MTELSLNGILGGTKMHTGRLLKVMLGTVKCF